MPKIISDTQTGGCENGCDRDGVDNETTSTDSKSEVALAKAERDDSQRARDYLGLADGWK